MLHRRVALCLLLSGAAGLVDEVVWSRDVAVLLGATAEAHALTLAVFLGGLAGGAALFGRLADRSASPLRLYALLEIGIALTTVLTPPALRLATRLFVPLASPLYPEHPLLVGALKLAVALVVLLPPTLLMGGTLPLVVKALVRTGPEIGSRVGLLYAANSAGGVVGALTAGVWLVPALGLDRVATLAACLNLLAAATALVPVGAGAKAESAEKPSDSAGLGDLAPRRVVLAVTAALALSGFASLVFETLWIRLLSLVLGGTAHAFPIMIAAFITGITAGARWAGRRERTWREALDLLVRAELAAALLVAVAFGLYQRLPWIDAVVSSALARNEAGYVLHLVFAYALATLVMAIPAAALGATLPLAAQVTAGRLEVLGRSFGDVYAWNTVGNVLGAVAGGLVLMPLLGLQGAFAVGVVLTAIAGLLPLVARHGRAALPRPLAVAGLAVVVLVLAPYEPQLLSRGLFRQRGIDPGSYAEFTESFLRDTKVLFHADGAAGTVEVHEHPNAVRVLMINGKPDASTGVDMQTQLLSAHLPMLLHPAPVDVLIIGLGSGVSAAAALAHGPHVRVTVLEISPEVAAANAAFDSVTGGVLRDPRVRLVLDDARTFVRLSGDRFDVIASEPSNPWMAGISGLFTADFFAELRGLLRPGGVVVQWAQLYETSDTVMRTMIRSFRTQFPDATGWSTSGADLLLVGGVEPRSLDWEAIARRMAPEPVRASLEAAHVRGARALASLQIASTEAISAYAGAGPLHTDERPLLEFAGARNLYLGTWADALIESDERRAPGRGRLAIESPYLAGPLSTDDATSIVRALGEWRAQDPALVRSLLLAAYESAPEGWRPDPALVPAAYPELAAGARAEPVWPENAPAPQRLELAAWLLERELARSSVFRRPRVEACVTLAEEAIVAGVDDASRAWRVVAQARSAAGDRAGAQQAVLQARRAPGAARLDAEAWNVLIDSVSVDRLRAAATTLPAP